MRLRTRPFILLAVLALLVVPVAAMADIKPIPRPTTPPAPPPSPPAKHPVKPPSTSTHTSSTPPANTSTGSGSTGSGSGTGSTGTPTTGTGSTGTPTTGTGSTGTPTTGTGSTGTPTTGTGSTGTGTIGTPADAVPVLSEGGRDQSLVAPAVLPPPDPTPLALVGAADPAPSQSSGTPAWKLALLALLAGGEAFIVVRLLRRAPATLSPAQ